LVTSSTSIFGHLTQFRARLRTSGLAYKPPTDELPLRSELFSADQMERHGKTLAAAHRLTPRRARDQLLPRLAANESVLIGICKRLTAAVSANHRISPAGEWLLDNFHLIEEQIGTAKRHLPRGYSRELPRLALGPSAGLPRVYDIALETISHGDGRVDADGLSRFVAAYQSVTTLKLGELWAIPIMLRLALIENLRRVGVRIAAGRAERDLANAWADRMMETAERDPKSLILVIADMARSTPPMGSAFVAELARRLQGQSAALALALTWIEQQLAESHLTIEQLVQSENQQQASDQVSISNSIGSLRFLGAIDWREFVEAISVVEKILRQDPQGVYGAMEFATRDRYRHATERIANDGRLSEEEVAAKAIQLARASGAVKGNDDRAGHVGFYLIDEGLPELERAAAVDVSSIEALRGIGRRYPLPVYLGAIALIVGVLTAGLVATAHAAGVNREILSLVVVLCLLASSQLAVTMVNWLATLLVTPHSLPRMDFSAGIAAKARTLVVVPTMLTSDRNVEDLVEALEVRFLANRDHHLHFALLTDFPDAREESLPGDELLLRLVEARINELNRKYGRGEHPSATESGNAHDGDADHSADASVFYLFHRPRRWNAEARIWMGFERKRGKLGDLNSLLRGGRPDGFSLIVGATAILSQVKYVITLDTDTQLPRDAARQFVGAMAHPLNIARFDESGKNTSREVVTSGYGILQPRVSVSLPGTNRSRYARLYGGEPGIDQYTRTVSDVYQDAFDEGSFIGKGIYDVDAFERALKGRFPINRVLSHDLLEGCYARAGLLSDAELYEEFPARYSADVARRRRWIRGDWQLMGWLRRRVKGPDGRRERNPLSMLSQWKVFDNLRRSLVPAALTLLLLLGWTVLSTAWLWTAVVVGILLVPSVIALLSDLADKPAEVSFRQHLAAVLHAARRHVVQALLALAFLPYEAFFCLDAIVRTIGRMTITHRRLLEWNPSSDVDHALEQCNRTDLLASYRCMGIAPAIAIAAWVGLSFTHPAVLAVAGPILLLWGASPAIAWWVSRPLARRSARLTVDQTHFLRKLARKTWAYFETYVGPDDHWLPPDNVQEHPAVKVAHRTSPTNMGLALLANLTAHDFGYLSTGQLVVRTTNALGTMESLERHRGHFYNWYDTQTRLPLAPLYVSTVDSGNLAGHLLTLRPGLTALCDTPILNSRWIEGTSDTFRILVDAVGDDSPATVTQFAQFESALDSVAAARPITLADAWVHVERLAACATDAAAHFTAQGANGPVNSEGDASFWARALARQTAEFRDELILLAPWLELRTVPGAGFDFPGANSIPTLRELAALDTAWSAIIERGCNGPTKEGRDFFDALQSLVKQGAERATARMVAIDQLALQATALAAMDYGFLFDKVRRQLVIGYNVAERRYDSSYYDLLASEARLCNFVAIAQGELPQESWFALGRLLTSVGGEPVLLSWSGSMFEYLMPLLVMPTYENTLLDQTYVAAVERQIEYGRQRGVPWGMSEGGYNTVDVHLNYQYRAFGVPGLGLKRGLGDDLVVAPYASALALMVAPEAACLNLQRLAIGGLAGTLGLFEAIDYTPSRQRRGESSAVVRSFMAHHQAMSLLAFAYALLARPMQKRFESDPLFQATLLLLQERIPRATLFHLNAPDLSDLRAAGGGPELPVRVLTSPGTAIPEVQLLSNGRYHVMVTNAGGGSSRWKDLAVTRWREDSTSDNWGTFCYLRDEASGEFWSTAYQPTLKQAEHYEAIFSEGRAEFRRRDFDFETHTEIVVSPEDDIEVRRVHITNRSRTPRTIDVTSYAEVVLAPAAADALHPAFSNLFVQTEILRGRHAILCTRRPRSREEQVPWMFHLMTVHGADGAQISFETDRMRFIGRGGSVVAPLAMTDPGTLSNTAGSVLDPIAAIRHRMIIDAGATATIDMVSGAAETRDAVLHLVDKYQDRSLADRVFELTWTHSQVVLRQLNATEADSQLYARLASSVIYANASLRAAASVLVSNRRGQSGLWGYAISGDLPIVLLQIADGANIELVRQLVQAHAYWRLKGLAVDLVIWNEDHDIYRQRLQEQIIGLIAAGVEAHFVDRPGGIFVRHAEQISTEDRVLFQSAARAIITDSRGTLSEQINRRMPTDVRIPRLAPTRNHRPQAFAATESPRDVLIHDLVLFNGAGGFSPDGREYVIAPAAGDATPAPWVNVLANPCFGTVVSESGLGYTWGENAHLFRLTPWHNDPVGEASGEALYLRDEETGHFWSPTSSPCGGALPYVTRHGFGYSVFEHMEDGIRSELTVFVALDAAIKFSSLKVSNHSGRPRRLSVTGYVEWVLGDLRAKSAMHMTTEIDAKNGALYARNPYNSEFSDWVGFFDVDESTRTVSGDRTEFLGRNGTLRDPAAMHRTRLSGKVGAALDPCAAIQVAFDLAEGQHRETVFRLGAGRNADATGQLVQRFRGSAVAHDALESVVQHWRHTLTAVQIETPDAALNILTNGWLVYQTMACRLWARSGYYQSGGAYGFRDQLQDVMALVHAEPSLVRAQIALCASRQFIEGDVQHWWHPPAGRGVRTHCSDDYLWLPLATCRYVLTTGDMSILDETAHFLEGRPVNAEDDSYYDLPGPSDESTNVYQHCVRAILHGLRFGAHGLPLIGSGDWNDGMNLVGRHGKGESVWLAFFLCHVLGEFAKVARLRDDSSFADRCEMEAMQLRQRIEQNAWDGEWYRRAYFDDGSPLGSMGNAECQIDSIAQSWAVLSGAGDAARSRMAMNAVNARLVRREHALIQLLDPPFDTSDLEPGYIRGYVPGVRENGGQYTHSAIWTAMAFAALGDGARAWELTAMINPINHARTPEDAATYKVEPYVVAADVYALAPHTGRGGWTWYTGSAGWMYRLVLESLLGLKLEVDRLRFAPCVPPEWNEFALRYRFRETYYQIAVRRTEEEGDEELHAVSVIVDGIAQEGNFVVLADDRQEHRIEVRVPSRCPVPQMSSV
jgi:cyclic beta-1,2-glucan synthetase